MPLTCASERTASACPVYVRTQRSPAHSLIVRSPEAVRMWPSASSRGNTAHTVASWPLSVWTQSPSFQTLAVLSHEAESSVPPASE